jgi:glutathione S-transferase
MSKPTVFGFPQSTYVRTVRLALAEKGIDCDLVPTGFSSEHLKELHPFRRIPAFRHDTLTLFETTAICRYIDDAFAGPALSPTDAAGLARMEQWISVINAYLDPPVIRAIVTERITRPMQNQTTDEAKCLAAKPLADHALSVLDHALGGQDFLAGSTISLADFFLLPILFYLRQMPEGIELLPGHKNLGAWYGRMETRPSFAATQPPAPGAR